MSLESVLMDTSYNLELEKIKNKIRKLYRDLLVKTYRAANPGATPQDIENFIDMNDLEFKDGEDFDEDSEDLEAMLDFLSKEDHLDEVKDKKFAKADVENGKELKSKSNEKTKAPKTSSLDIPKGGLFIPPDFHRTPETKSLETPKGRINRKIDDNPTVKTEVLKDIWDKERDKLLALVRERNKEYGVRL